VIGQDWYATHVAARLQDFFFVTAPWQRRLWDAGTVFALKELLDASRWRAEHVLSEGAVYWLSHELERIVGVDHGVGDRATKVAITAELKTGVPYDTRHWRRLDQLVPHVEQDYLQRWAAAVDGQTPPGAERLARAIAAHLLDRGYSMAFLHSWVKRHIGGRSQLQELLADGFVLDEQPDHQYEVLLPFEAVPHLSNAQAQANWLDAPLVKSWLAKHGGQGDRPVRYLGAFTYEVRAKDPYAAARVVAGVLERLLARASYAPNYARMRPCGVIWVHDQARPSSPTPGTAAPTFDVRPLHRGTYVRSLTREDKVHDVGLAPTALDDALELAASLNSSSSPGPAIVGGWSALESLLFSPADPQDSKDGRGVVACDRAAALVACSWPRAELTPLAYAHQASGPAAGSSPRPVGELAAASDARNGATPTGPQAAALRRGLDDADSNRARCRLLLQTYDGDQRLELDKTSDIAAQERMLALVANPRSTLTEVRGHVQHAFRRMYRFRNIVVHGGAASSSGVEVALRTAAPLAGAALDRISHAKLVDHISPLALAARADLHLELVGSTGGPGLADLLE